MVNKKYLIVNADDFGLSYDVNRGIIKAYENGIVTSTSLMVRWQNAEDAAVYGREHPDFDIGIHFDFGEWAYRDEDWVAIYEVVSTKDVTAVRDEVFQQLDTFRSLMGKDPTHIDSHQHVHLNDSLIPIFANIAKELGVPLRRYNSEIQYFGGFYGQTDEGLPYPDGISVDNMIHILESLPAGITELACHPSDGIDLDTMYRNERMQELKVLCDPRIRATIGALGIKLCSFTGIKRYVRG